MFDRWPVICGACGWTMRLHHAEPKHDSTRIEFRCTGNGCGRIWEFELPRHRRDAGAGRAA